MPHQRWQLRPVRDNVWLALRCGWCQGGDLHVAKRWYHGHQRKYAQLQLQNLIWFLSLMNGKRHESYSPGIARISRARWYRFGNWARLPNHHSSGQHISKSSCWSLKQSSSSSETRQLVRLYLAVKSTFWGDPFCMTGATVEEFFSFRDVKPE